MGNDVEDGPELFDATLRRPRGVADDRPTNDAGDAARQPTERVDQAHCLGQPGGFAFDHQSSALRGLVARCEAGATGRDDETCKAAAHLAQGVGDVVHPVSRNAMLDDDPSGARELLDERSPAEIFASPMNDPVADGENLGTQRLVIHGLRRYRISTIPSVS